MTENIARLRVNTPEVTAKFMDGEVIAIHLTTGVYYSLDGVAGRIWSYVENGWDVSGIVNAISADYRVTPDRCSGDVAKLIQDLMVEGLVVEGAAGPQQPVAPQAPSPYSAPAMNVFRDMSDLLALDPPMPGFEVISWEEPPRGGTG